MGDEAIGTADTVGPAVGTPAAEAGDRVGQVIDGRYRVLERLGEGGMGEVFLAEHLTLQKQVALKTIHAALGGHQEVAARFAREAMASARIEHPRVVSALDYGELPEGGAYLVMQFVAGPSLRDVAHGRGPWAWREACEVAEQIADATVAAHAAGIVHRDLKPENVVMLSTAEGQVDARVLDFGIAHLRGEQNEVAELQPDRALTQVGAVIGTPGYMSPEQAVGQGVDERTDIYAIGVILWELLAGRAPFVGGTLAEIVSQQFADTPPRLPAEARVPGAVTSLLYRCLRQRADGRPQAALELREELRRLRALPDAGGGLALEAAKQKVLQTGDAVAEGARASVASARQVLEEKALPAAAGAAGDLRTRFEAASQRTRWVLIALAVLLGLWGASAVLGGDAGRSGGRSGGADASEERSGGGRPRDRIKRLFR